MGLATDNDAECCDLSVLTSRQREVLNLVSRGLRLKTVAAELGMSEGRVNQHVANIKQRLAVNDLIGIVFETDDAPPCRIPAGCNSDLSDTDQLPHRYPRISPGPIFLSDAVPLSRSAPWHEVGIRVGPEALEGHGARVKRLAFIAFIGFALPVLAILLVAAMTAITRIG